MKELHSQSAEISFSYGELKLPGQIQNAPHYHDFYEIYLCMCDDVRYLVGKQIYSLERGSLVLLNPFDLHRSLLPDHGVYKRYLVLFSPESVAGWNQGEVDLLQFFTRRSARFNHHCRLRKEALAEAVAIIEKGRACTMQDDPYLKMTKRFHLLELLLLITREYAAEGEPRPAVSSGKEIYPVLEYINENLSKELQISELARRFSTTEATLSRHFEADTGFSVKQYILHCRLHHARLLLHGGASVTEACYTSGFGNLSHFIRIFKEKTGCTPGSFKINKSRK